MIVEFIGAPGAGKTTMLQTVIDALQERGIKAYTILDAARPFAARTLFGKSISSLAPESLHRALLWQVFIRLSMLYRLRFFARHPKLIWLVFHTQRHRPNSAGVRERKILYWFFRIVGYYEFLRAHIQPNEALVFDEGFVHRVVQLNASGVEDPNPTQIFSYVDLLPRPDLLIFAKAPHDVCEKRIYKRGLWQRFSHKEPAEISRFVENAHLIVNLTVDHVKNKNWPVIEVDNGTDDLAGAQGELRRCILSRVSVPTDGKLRSQVVQR